MTSTDDVNKKLAKLALLKKKKDLQDNLPHKHGFKLYPWQQKHINSQEKMALICAANQIGKSACNVLKWITWATEPELWPILWPNRRPRTFWILLPTKDLITSEYRGKWIHEYLPKGEYKNHPQYGWEAETRSRHLWAIHFKTGITCYMHTYEQDVHHLQAGTVDALFVDEEPPSEIMPELLMRIAATEGYYNGVMTPTRGQQYWYEVFERIGEHDERFKDAFKQKVSLYECMGFSDGTPSRWTRERINRQINLLGSQSEIDLRIHGKFAKQTGLKVGGFVKHKNVLPASPVPHDWLWYSGVDIGSGGGAHPPAIAFIAVSPDFKRGRVVRCWRGKSTEIYTASDILQKYLEMRAGRAMTGEYYDWAAADFYNIAHRAGVHFQKAEKSHEIGYPLLNTLFKNIMLTIDDTPENVDLVMELLTLDIDTSKKKAVDDAVDATRYGIAKVPWNFEGIATELIPEIKKKVITADDIRRAPEGTFDDQGNSWEQEVAMWNDAMTWTVDE